MPSSTAPTSGRSDVSRKPGGTYIFYPEVERAPCRVVSAFYGLDKVALRIPGTPLYRGGAVPGVCGASRAAARATRPATMSI